MPGWGTHLQISPNRARLAGMRTAFWSGVRGIAPILIGVVPFGAVAGAAAVGVMGPWRATGMSLAMFAGASQLAATALMAKATPAILVVLAAWTVNLRFLLYSLSISPHFQEQPAWLRAGLAYLLTDQGYALCVVRFDHDPQLDRRGFYLGAATALWTTWQVSHLVGVCLGGVVPPEWHLEMAIPLMFLALLVPTVVSRPRLLAALVAALVALLAAGLPFKLGLMLGALAGVAAGVVGERWN